MAKWTLILNRREYYQPSHIIMGKQTQKLMNTSLQIEWTNCTNFKTPALSQQRKAYQCGPNKVKPFSPKEYTDASKSGWTYHPIHKEKQLNAQAWIHANIAIMKIRIATLFIQVPMHDIMWMLHLLGWQLDLMKCCQLKIWRI